MGDADVHRARERLGRLLDEKGIPYAVIGAMALNEWAIAASRSTSTCC